MERVFNDIYARNEWGPGSGPGSLPESTLEYRRVLQRLLWTLRPCRVLDVGCGYFEPYSALDWAGVEYLGVDVVPGVIESNLARFGGPSVRFARCDLTDRALRPAPSEFDLVLVKDVLQHWSVVRVIPFLRYLSAFPRVLITNSSNRVAENYDAPDGDFRALDVRLPPYCVPAREIACYEVVSNPPLDLKTVLYWEPPVERWAAPTVSLRILEPDAPVPAPVASPAAAPASRPMASAPREPVAPSKTADAHAPAGDQAGAVGRGAGHPWTRRSAQLRRRQPTEHADTPGPERSEGPDVFPPEP